MRHNHFSMLPEQAFQPRPFGGMTLEGGFFGGGGGGGGGGEAPPPPQRTASPRPVAPFTSAGGGFMGRTPYGSPGTSASFPQSRFNADYYLAQNPDVARDPYYGSNPFHHYQDFGFAERRTPSENFQYAPSQQRLYNPTYEGLGGRPDLVMDAYQRILGRTPDQEGFNFWTNEMNRGLTGQGLVSAGVTAPEFQRTQEYQRAYTEAFRPGYQEFGPTGQYNQPIYLGNYTNYARSPEFAQPLYNTTMMTPQDVGYGFGSFNPFAYGGTNPFAGDTAAPTGGSATEGGSPAAARGGRIKNDDGIAALLKR